LSLSAELRRKAMSPPAQNPRPSAWSMITHLTALFFHLSNASVIACTIGSVSAWIAPGG
jgi:hypothetical protein